MKKRPTAPAASSCPLTAREVLDLYFVEHRARLIDLAAFLDRIDRAQQADEVKKDHRLVAFLKAVRLLLDGKPARTRRILEAFSDPTAVPIPKAGTKGATGAYPGKVHPLARSGGPRR